MILLYACVATDPQKPSDTAAEDTALDTGTLPEIEPSLALPFTLDATGEGTDRLDALSLGDATGTLSLSGAPHDAVAYQDHAWDGAGYHLYDVLSIAEDGSDLAVTYLYCDGDTLPYAYTESFRHPMDWETASGSCEGEAAEIVVGPALPALSASPDPFDPGVRIDGDDVAFDGSSGFVAIDGAERALRPFNVVDCTDCPGGPWYEVHSLLDGEDDDCFAILYLYPDDPTYVLVAYGLCVPTLERVEATLPASWTGRVSAGMGIAGAPRGVPPPGLRDGR